MATPALFVAFGQRRLEVLCGAGFEAVCQQAEAALSLHPESYELYDQCGKVGSDNFDRALASSRGVCLLELREKPEWKKMREMEVQIQKLMERTSPDALHAAQLQAKQMEENVLKHVDLAIEKLKEEFGEKLDKTTLSDLSDSNSTMSRLANLETELAELVVNSSADFGHVESGLVTAQKELESLRGFTADQLQSMEKRMESMESFQKCCEHQLTQSYELPMVPMPDGVDLKELAEKIFAIETDLNEHAITASAMNGHLESAVATAKQELESLRACMSNQLKFVDARIDAMESVEQEFKPSSDVKLGAAWSDGFKSYDLRGLTPLGPSPPPGPGMLGKMAHSLASAQSAPSLKRYALPVSKSLPQLPPIS
ncbi:Uncharacterized protein SCF082_LOCUS1430 [Durusdinium trenchii]|uniref:Uncharacterized protein n=1 Tax=Durusdinium trenchii TaxID=1381693 RepID=A0ABP0HGS1_9DINO